MRATIVILSLALCATCAMALDQVRPIRAVANSAENFATSFVKAVSSENKGKNLISSPLSAHIVLSMAAYGAAGKTAQEMRQSLHLPENDAMSRQGFQSLIDQLNNVENVTLEVANKMYLAEGLTLKPKYKQLTADNFRSEASQIKVEQPTESANLVNGWVKERTHDKIQEIVKPDDINPDTRMLLLNAVYFKGKWAQKFKKESTEDRTFHLDEKNEKKVPTMYNMGEYFYGELPDLKARFIELPYENKYLKMVIIVPDEINGLNNILNNLESFNYTRLASSGSKRDVHLHLPKFKIESSIDLREPLSQMGMSNMFSDSADFSGISNVPLKVAKVLQKAYIEVNEEGSEAAAVTGIWMIDSAMPGPPLFIEELHVNRAFYFSILKNDVELFAGIVHVPSNL
ncbi:serine protease inhibitor 3/4-like isoform X4 [Phymastichus coffea]|uniref:serine protease inhibitor 3/4-like isoform X4 n=1 Tax=Phymastichus coffea TaxID=108790 RepID=UPI00273B41FE|nr:serine protease inhibitor 3/4-like isoform X4 [Phymastichus coffea]